MLYSVRPSAMRGAGRPKRAVGTGLAGVSITPGVGAPRRRLTSRNCYISVNKRTRKVSRRSTIAQRLSTESNVGGEKVPRRRSTLSTLCRPGCARQEPASTSRMCRALGQIAWPTFDLGADLGRIRRRNPPGHDGLLSARRESRQAVRCPRIPPAVRCASSEGQLPTGWALRPGVSWVRHRQWTHSLNRPSLCTTCR